MTTSFGFGEDFDLELEEAGRSSNRSFAPRKRQKPAPVIGPEIPFAKAGVFEVKTKNAQGKEITKRPSELQVIILDAKFGRQQWVDNEGKGRMICSTVTHFVKDREGNAKEIEGGWWQIPYGAQLTNEKYSPVGTKQNTDGTFKSCIDCMANNENEGCTQKGYTYVYVVGMSNEDGEMVAVKQPFVATIKTPNASGIAFQIYTTKKLRERGFRPSHVVSTLSITKTPNKMANQLVFEFEDKVDEKVLKAAQDSFSEMLTAWEAEDAKKAEERKAKWEENNKGRAAAASSAPRPKKNTAEDDVPFGDDDDFSF